MCTLGEGLVAAVCGTETLVTAMVTFDSPVVLNILTFHRFITTRYFRETKSLEARHPQRHSHYALPLPGGPWDLPAVGPRQPSPTGYCGECAPLFLRLVPAPPRSSSLPVRLQN